VQIIKILIKNINKLNKMPKKVVRFDKANIYLIQPAKCNAECELWWSTEEQIEAKQSCFREIDRIRLIHGRNMTLSDALKLLYQPNNVSYSEENFRY
jgi:hypothetical protein